MLCLSALVSASSPFIVKIPRDGALSMYVTVDVGSSSASRLSVEFSDDAAAVSPLASPSLDEGRAMANFTRVSDPDGDLNR